MSESKNQNESQSQNAGTNATLATNLVAEVADLIKNSASTVREKLKNSLVEREVNSRVDVLDKALTKLRDSKNEANKVKPDQVSIDADGKKTESFSKEQWKKRQDAMEAVEKLSKAVESALAGETADSFNKLRELVK